jgi:zinc transporter
MAMRAFLFTDGKATELPFADGAAQFGKADLVWLHLDGQREEARDWIDSQHAIPSIVRNALRASETRPRSDILDGGSIINLRGLGEKPEEAADPLVSIRFWAEKGQVISLSYRPLAGLNDVISWFLGGQIKDPGDLITAFATEMSKGLDPKVAALGDVLDSVEARIEENNARSTRRKVSKVRAQAIGYRRFVAPQREALERLSTARCSWLDEEDQSHLREASDRYARMAEELEAVRERAAVVHDELTDLRTERMDARALLISIVALIFLPLTFITGLLGMNVKGIPYADKAWAFWGVVGLCAVLGAAVLAYFIRLRWVRDR